MLMRTCCIALLTLAAAPAAAEDWPAFRGPRGDGISRDTNIPVEWGPDENIAWRSELPAPGNSSPVVSNGRVFVTCATDEGGKRNLYSYDRTDGKRLWVKTVHHKPGEDTHKTNPYCGSTPAADGERVVVWHGSAGLFCYDFDGSELWSNDLGDVGHIWGYGSSPVLHDGKVILNFGPGEDTFLAALDLENGELLWKTPEPGGNNARQPRMVGTWSTPVVAEVDGDEQIICSMPTRVVAYEPHSGEILWTCGGLPSPRGDLVYTSPQIADNLGVAMGGFRGPSIAFRLGGTGDVTARNRLWRNTEKQPQRIGSGVVVDGAVYVANAGPSTIECIDLQTGEIRWRERVKGGFWGSTVYADGRLYATNKDGVTYVFRPNPKKFEPVARNDLGEPSNSTPAFSDGQIFLRTFRAVYCVDDG